MPFCFRCGGEVRYQLSIRIIQADGSVAEGPFWPLCAACFQIIPWDETLRKTISFYETEEKE